MFKCVKNVRQLEFVGPVHSWFTLSVRLTFLFDLFHDSSYDSFFVDVKLNYLFHIGFFPTDNVGDFIVCQARLFEVGHGCAAHVVHGLFDAAPHVSCSKEDRYDR